MISFAELDRSKDASYLRLLSVMSKLSKLFSESEIPYIEYRVVENVFCRSFDAINLSRKDTAFDANYSSVGIGIKTFISQSNRKTEKIAEFNQLSNELRSLSGKKLALRLGELRNERIDLARRTYGLKNSLYHIVARRKGNLLIFETDYEKIDMRNIRMVKTNDSSIQFEDGINSYKFSFSKSTLYREFEIPSAATVIPVDILEDPYSLILDLFKSDLPDFLTKKTQPENEYVILPLYSRKGNVKNVPPKSGLNHWNAGGRARDYGEVYIPIPASIHANYPGFFPARDQVFQLQIPTGEMYDAKVCQAGSKALMTNPNNALSDWLLRRVFKLREGELLKLEKMHELGFDSVMIEKVRDGFYKIDKAKVDSFERFMFAETFNSENG